MPRSESYQVVIPAYNVERFIGEAIASILSQSIPPERVIVVDDGSTDGTAAVARACGPAVTVVSQPNRGPGTATSVGAAMVTTPFIAFNDADDVWLPGKMEKQFARLADDGLDLAFAHVCLMYDGQPPDHSRTQENWTRTTMLVRAEAYRRVGPVIDMPAMHGDMIDWVARARDLGVPMTLMPEVLCIRRIREGSLTYRRGGEHGYLSAVKAALDRRRAKNSGGA